MRVIIDDVWAKGNIRKGYSPYIDEDTLTWWEWDEDTRTFIDTGKAATMYEQAVQAGYDDTEQQFNLLMAALAEYLKDNQWLQYYRGSVESYLDLPTRGMQKYDVYMIETDYPVLNIKAGDCVFWDGTKWEIYWMLITSEEIDEIIGLIE